MQTENPADSDNQLISVIMPCYNAVPYLRESVASVMDQTYSRTELVIVDDGSTDGSIDLLKQLADEYPDRIVLLFQDHGGPYAARNHALRHAKGSMIAFLDADDWWRDDFLEKLAVALENNNDAALA